MTKQKKSKFMVMMVQIIVGLLVVVFLVTSIGIMSSKDVKKEMDRTNPTANEQNNQATNLLADKVKKLKEEIKKNPSDSKTRLELGKTYSLQRQYDLAIEEYKEIIKSNASNLDAYMELADCYERKEMPKEAVAYYQQALEVMKKEKIDNFRIEAFIKNKIGSLTPKPTPSKTEEKTEPTPKAVKTGEEPTTTPEKTEVKKTEPTPTPSEVKKTEETPVPAPSKTEEKPKEDTPKKDEGDK